VNLHDELHRRCQAFAQEIADLVTTTVRDAFSELSFNGVRSPGPLRIVRAGGLAKGEKRSPEAIAELAERFHQQVHATPGQRIEVLADAMQVSTRELNLPVKKLTAAKRLTTKGQKRATRYWAK
jgi:hypothetical protein